MDRRPASGTFKISSSQDFQIYVKFLLMSSFTPVIRVAHVDYYTYRRPAAWEFFVQATSQSSAHIENFSAARPSSSTTNLKMKIQYSCVRRATLRASYRSKFEISRSRERGLSSLVFSVKIINCVKFVKSATLKKIFFRCAAELYSAFFLPLRGATNQLRGLHSTIFSFDHQVPLYPGIRLASVECPQTERETGFLWVEKSIFFPAVCK
ncbi:hypothetical protein R3P38DRAFT_2793994 [Favolaschia claudopus]|uniref:Uncharacterized protein n=1 Tax=Favolaschia claudopus TaxID=2862362 RepID=A0AAW0AAW5_9AGAR